MPKEGYAQANIRYEIYDYIRTLRYTKIKVPLRQFIETAIVEKLLRDGLITPEEAQKIAPNIADDLTQTNIKEIE